MATLPKATDEATLPVVPPSERSRKASALHRIVVVGGGAGGLELATRMGDTLGKRNRAHVTLVEKTRTHFWKPHLHEIAAGSMNLGVYETNYLAQSVVLSLLFYGYGLGLYGRLGSLAAVGVGLAVYAGQVVFSWAWLGRYRFGPVEWVWRSLTYGRGQPMRRAGSDDRGEAEPNQRLQQTGPQSRPGG